MCLCKAGKGKLRKTKGGPKKLKKKEEWTTERGNWVNLPQKTHLRKSKIKTEGATNRLQRHGMEE